jgi:Uroporphyrinogen-III synthase
MKTLENKIIISTRPLSNDDTMKKALIAKGATVLDFPMITILTNEANAEIRSVLANINTFQWLLFTSKNGVDSFFKILKEMNPVGLPKIAVIGKTTANEVQKNGFNPEFISTGNTSEDFIEELKNELDTNDKALIILGELADTKFEQELSTIAKASRLNVYKTIGSEIYSLEIVNRIAKGAYDMLVFTSPSGFRNFVKVMAENNCNGNFKIACIGKTTEKEVLDQGYTPLIVSKKPGGDSFADEIKKYFKASLNSSKRGE